MYRHTNSQTSKLTKLKHWLKQKITTKEFIIGSIVFVILLAGALALVLSNTVKAPLFSSTSSPSPSPAPTVYTSKLTGSIISQAESKQPITGVMVENSTFARPQSGIREAGVIFEGIAEGGITRFLLLYQENNPKSIGPVRSVRPYYLQWALGFDASIAHVGGSPQALKDIRNWRMKDLDQFFNSGSYHRISSRSAPHNVYTSLAELHRLEKRKGWTKSKFNGFTRKTEAPAAKSTAKTIDFKISSASYNVRYIYNPSTNSYKRSVGGSAHRDAVSGKQLAPKVVIGIVMPFGIASDGHHSDYDTIGSGKVYIFQDGGVTLGTWTKKGNGSQFSFKDKSGKTIALNPGQTWITALGSQKLIGYKP